MLATTWRSIVSLGPEGSKRRSAQMTILSVGAMGLGTVLLFLALLPAGALRGVACVGGGWLGVFFVSVGVAFWSFSLLEPSWSHISTINILPTSFHTSTRVHPRPHGCAHGELPPHLWHQDVHQPR